MPLESEADRLGFVEIDAVTGVIGNKSIRGIFDNDYVPIGDEYVVESSSPRFVCRTSDVPAAVENGKTLITIGNVQYVIVESMSDGTGMTELRLRDGE